jgi:ribosomal protein S18 acetylase RimI-like enzyme
LIYAGPDPEPQDDQRLSLVRRPALSFRMLTAEDELTFRALRLEALRRHPEAFVPSYEEERGIDPEVIQSPRPRSDWMTGGNFILGAYAFGWLAGAVGVRRWPRRKQRHKATLWLIYTDPALRGQGAGRKLLEQAIDLCRSDPELELLHLSVGSESQAARVLYTSLGFEPYGMEPQAMKLEDRYIDVELMSLSVRDETA